MSIAVDKTGNTVVAGTYAGTLTFAPGPTGTFTSDTTSCALGSYFVASFSPAGKYNWGLSFDAEGGNNGSIGVAVDNAGNIFLAASQYQAFNFNQTMYQGTGLFLAAVSSTGMVEAAQSYAGAGVGVAGVATTTNGWVIAGTFYGSLKLGANTLTTTAGGIRANAFVAQFANALSPVAAKGYGDAPGYPAGGQGASGLASEAGGNVVLAGSFSSTIALGSMPLVANGATDIYLAKFPQPLDTALWSKHYGGQGYPSAAAVAFDAIGSILLAGILTAPIDLGNGQPASVPAQTGYFDGFIAKYDPTGSYKWSKTFGGAMEAIGHQSIMSDANDNIFVSGQATTPIDFGGGALIPAGKSTPSGILPNVYVVKLDANGNQLWAKMFGDANGQQDVVATTDPTTGEVLLAFENNGTVNFSDGAVSTQGLVVARLHP